MSEEKKRAVGPLFLLVISSTHQNVFHRSVGVVGISRREVSENLGAIETLPVEGVVWKLVEEVPRELLSEEILDPALQADLRKLGAVAESVWKPEDTRVKPKLPLKELLSKQKLSTERFPTRNLLPKNERYFWRQKII